MAVIEVEPGLAEMGERMLDASEDLEFIERDLVQYARPAIVPNDPLFPQQWSHHNTCMKIGWDVVRHANPQELVAVLDSGIRYTIPELTPNIAYNSAELGNDEDNSGIIGDYWGASFDTLTSGDCYNPPNDPWDRCGHGTSMASIIGSLGNNHNPPQMDGLFCGTAWTCKMLAVQIYGTTSQASWAAKGMEYAHFGRGSRLMNCSFVFYDSSPAIKSVIENTPEVLCVCAAGNDCVNLDVPSPPGCTPQILSYPAMYLYSNLLVVGGSDPNDAPNATCGCPEYNYGSGYGAQSVDVFAPSTNIWQLSLAGTAGNSDTGTSHATAITTGLALLLWTQEPTRSVADIKAKIMDTVDIIPALTGKCVTGGRINAGRALSGDCQ